MIVIVEKATDICEGCGRRWVERTERWRAYLTDDEPPVAALFCPECSRNEFEDE
jgi:hypothetical protein